jgi:uncharacterized protein
MKPGDHPESTIVLTKGGRFFHDGAPVEHPGMKKAFASWLTRHPDDGRDILSNGYDWTYLTVEGARRFVQAVRSGAGGPQLVLLDGQELPLDPTAVCSDAEGQLWVLLPGSEMACFTAAAQLELAPWLVERAGVVGLEIDGHFCAIAGPGAVPSAGPQPKPGS